MTTPHTRIPGFRIPTPFPCFCLGCGALAVLVLTLWRILS